MLFTASSNDFQSMPFNLWILIHSILSLNGVSNLIYYTKKGQWEGSLKVYSEDKLARDIRDIVKREYYDYDITSVQEIETFDSYGIPTYIVHLEDSNNIKLIRVRYGVMDVYSAFKKG